MWKKKKQFWEIAFEVVKRVKCEEMFVWIYITSGYEQTNNMERNAFASLHQIISSRSFEWKYPVSVFVIATAHPSISICFGWIFLVLFLLLLYCFCCEYPSVHTHKHINSALKQCSINNITYQWPIRFLKRCLFHIVKSPPISMFILYIIWLFLPSLWFCLIVTSIFW